ncbi:DUF4317 domain-containing protein [Ornithinibacillus sp. 4-3]|uniref:DUF4317 domain-containing protein n=1 Tax=Ornithinibacillus sp. 4-3 TaxID=3231488 RepID=A0AB39HSB1_9BACI
MNKKDIANFRKQLKINNDLLRIKELYYVYVMKESKEVYHHQSVPFEMLEKEQQELFIANYKKLLSGHIDEKLFALKFKREEENSQQLLHQGLNSKTTEEWTEYMLELVEKILAGKQFEMDTVITFIRGDYMKPVKPTSEEYEESDRDQVYSNSFILCSINKTQEPKKELLFDYIEKEFKYNIIVDPIINLKAPLSGFLYPCFMDNAADVNHVLYGTGKKYELDYHFIEEVLNVEEATTAEDDKIVFEEVVKHVTDDPLNTTTLSSMYEEIYRVVEENEEEEQEARLDYRDVEKVLKNSGITNIDVEAVETAFKTVVDDSRYELKASNVVPKATSKSIKIKTKVADLSISPQELNHVRQVEFGGKLYLMIELEENTTIEGFEMAPESLFRKGENELDH